MKTGKQVIFHGAFSAKSDARKKEHQITGAFIHGYNIKGHRRFVVMTPRKKR